MGKNNKYRMVQCPIPADCAANTVTNEQLAAVNQYSFFGFMGIASALVFANLGAAYGTARSGVGICSIGVLRSDLVFKSLIPGIMAGILGIYGLIVSVIYLGGIKESTDASIKPLYTPFQGYKHLAEACAVVSPPSELDLPSELSVTPVCVPTPRKTSTSE